MRIIIFLGLFNLLIGIADGNDWPQWRGPTGDGISKETDWSHEKINNDMDVQWRTYVGAGHSNVSVKGDWLYTLGNHQKKKCQENTIVCLNVLDGEEVWSFSYPCKRGGEYPGPGATPLIDGSSLYSISIEGDLFCLDALKGNVIWKRNITRDSKATPPDAGWCSSPVIDGDLLVLNVGKSGMAYNKKTGMVIWKSAAVKGEHSTPVFYTANKKRMAAITSNGMLNAVEVETGRLWWSLPFETATDPIISNNRMLVYGYRSGMLLDLEGEKPEIVWKNKSWNGSLFQSSVVVNGYAYGFGVVNTSQPVRCFDLKTGKKMWSQEITGLGAMIASNGKLLLLHRDGELIIAEASHEKYKEIRRAKVLSMRNKRRSRIENGNYGCWIAPVLSNGKLFLKNTFGELVCLDLSLKEKH